MCSYEDPSSSPGHSPATRGGDDPRSTVDSPRHRRVSRGLGSPGVPVAFDPRMLTARTWVAPDVQDDLIVRRLRGGHPRALGSAQEARGPWRLPSGAQSDAQRRVLRAPGRSDSPGFAPDLRLVPRRLRRERGLYTLCRRARPVAALRRRVPGLQTQRTALGTPSETVDPGARPAPLKNTP